MAISDKNFKLSKSAKRMAALLRGSKEDKNHFKRMMIAAQVKEEAVIKTRLKGRDKSSD
jgi:hypothetical protein